ncbi:hypothetical protein TPHA_0D04730 [Tetrapisispora phaffii CBS 4417]|uniref:Uncharacterized protein n=1 Tax=Tetrapisispora phaffii (strain ATCC 24235 / CBS 4417 / NBRC 1672 / NRRL Y-8282 / UCD 70-5) TaxID=1071381 RepID=G8BS31_TETPH|nr:hypothetical protein TPHA_0D04730 [Tetrapisispora phaffii CBS 4417]CCE63106.1 hypothetical protein TPHA_0D04730 [Tetrapisispora phaffii CBS 4417]
MTKNIQYGLKGKKGTLSIEKEKTENEKLTFNNFRKVPKIVIIYFLLFIIVFVLSTLYFRNHDLYGDKKVQSVAFTAGIAPTIAKRSHWYWAAAAALGGFLVTAAALSGGYAVTACSKDLGSPNCWISVAIALVSGSLGGVATAAAGVAGAAASAAANAKRDGGFISSIGPLDFYHTSLTNLTQLNSTFVDAGLTLLGAFEYTNTSDSSIQTQKRGLSDGNRQHVLYFKSAKGNHVASHLNNDIDRLVSSITNQVEPGSLSDTIGNYKSLQRRYNYFDAEWISWNWDNVNVDLTRDVEQDRGLEEEEYDQGFYNFFSGAPAWKYCWAVTVNPHPGQNEGYDQIGDGNAVHGELYFNTYGGVDGYCNDNKDGAQCPNPACES